MVKPYIRFDLIEKKPKTNVYAVINISGEYPLGHIKWYGSWRQYCFFADEGSIILNKGCMQTIFLFIQELMEKRRLNV